MLKGCASSSGVVGTTLFVLYTHPTLTGRRHVVIRHDRISNTTTTVTGLPTSGTAGQMLVSFGYDWECGTEQNNTAAVGGATLSTVAGGKDDGSATTCGTDYNSLITGGDFGFNDSDTWIGIDGDSPTSEPAGGTSTNGRLSDLTAAARILKGRRTAEGVRFIVAPASRNILTEGIKRGVAEVLLSAGAVIVAPGCGPCVGTHAGVDTFPGGPY